MSVHVSIGRTPHLCSVWRRTHTDNNTVYVKCHVRICSIMTNNGECVCVNKHSGTSVTLPMFG